MCFFGPNQLSGDPVFFWLEGHTRRHHDLHTLSGLYGERSLHRSHGERRQYVDGGLAPRAPVRFPMFSCHVVEAGLDFLHTPWHEQKHQNRRALGPKLPRLKSSPVASETFRNSSHRWKTLAEKAFPISTRVGPERSCNSVSAFAAHLEKGLRNFKSIGTQNFLWPALRRRSRASHSSRPLLPRLSRRNVIYKEERLLPKSQQRCRFHQYPHAHR